MAAVRIFFAVQFFNCHNRNHCGLAGLENAALYGIHLQENLVIRKANYLPGVIINAEDKLAAGGIGKGHCGSEILFCFSGIAGA